MKQNNQKYKEENKKLAANVGELKKTQGKLSSASQLLKGEVADLKKIQEKVVEMNDRTFSVIKERETIAGKQRRMITMQKEEQLEYESEDVLNRVRAYFDDAAGENNKIEEKEYPALVKHIQKIPALSGGDFKMLKFSDFSDEYDDNAAEIEKYEATSKIRPLLKEYFEMKKKKLQEELKADEKAAAAKFEDIEKTLKTTQEMKLKGKAFTKA